MIIAFVLFAVGLIFSAFFSGCETGLYRVSRTKLVLDGLSGSRTSRGIVWLLNHPSMFVATTLVGNNVANYLTSFAIVLGVATLFGENSIAELMGPILMTPFVFVFGELLPKYLFYQAPYRLLKPTRPVLLVAAGLFAPVSLILGLLGSLLQSITGQTPFQMRLTMARRELDQVLRAGHEAGILESSQRQLATKLFETRNKPAIKFGVPMDRLAVVDSPICRETACRRARRVNHPIILVRSLDRISGFLHYVDLMPSTIQRGTEDAIEPLPIANGLTNESHLVILLRLYDLGSDVAVLYDEQGQEKCVVTRRQLLHQLIGEHRNTPAHQK